jgi:exonuclease VII small subunit
MSDDTVPGQLDAILVRLEKGDARMNSADVARAEMSVKLDSTVTKLDQHDLKLDTLITAMAENTAVTNTVKDALTTARVGRTLLIWLGGIAGAIAAIWGAVVTIRPH